MSRVIAMPGATLPNEPDAALIEKCRELLADAEAGRLRGLAYAALRGEHTITCGWSHVAGTGHHLSTGVLRLMNEYARGWVDE